MKSIFIATFFLFFVANLVAESLICEPTDNWQYTEYEEGAAYFSKFDTSKKYRKKIKLQLEKDKIILSDLDGVIAEAKILINTPEIRGSGMLVMAYTYTRNPNTMYNYTITRYNAGSYYLTVNYNIETSQAGIMQYVCR
ncbi:MAG: hypothetical protein FWE18_03670 [Alphaproteobacteria bacterium]|nr:hypothetical protein [Alphaproteobacteria bacterium]